MLKDNILKGKCVSRFRNQFQKLEFHDRMNMLLVNFKMKCVYLQFTFSIYISNVQ